MCQHLEEEPKRGSQPYCWLPDGTEVGYLCEACHIERGFCGNCGQYEPGKSLQEYGMCHECLEENFLAADERNEYSGEPVTPPAPASSVAMSEEWTPKVGERVKIVSGAMASFLPGMVGVIAEVTPYYIHVRIDTSDVAGVFMFRQRELAPIIPDETPIAPVSNAEKQVVVVDEETFEAMGGMMRLIPGLWKLTREGAITDMQLVTEDVNELDTLRAQLAAVTAERNAARKQLAKVCNLADRLDSQLVTRDDGKLESMYTIESGNIRDDMHDAVNEAWVLLGEIASPDAEAAPPQEQEGER